MSAEQGDGLESVSMACGGNMPDPWTQESVAEQGDVEALEIARTLVAEGRGYGTWENRLAEALIACSAALERAERERSPASAILRAAIDFARAEKAERALAEIARLSPFVSPEDDNSIRKAPAIARSALRPSEDNQR